MVLKRALAILIVSLTLPYACGPIYTFPAPARFTGSQLWNPYAGLGGRWLRSNFHAHGRAWGGVTNGAQRDADVIDAYRRAGYQVAAVSDYQHIAEPAGGTPPVYEHGYNLAKHHQLVIGARDVDWFDFPLWQGLQQKQYILDRLKPTGELLSINHPSRLHSYTVEDVRRLTGYDLMEVANGRVTTEDRWDAALSTGHPVWAIGGDDTHDVLDPNRMAVAWTMIDGDAPIAAHVIDALRAGRAYIVIRTSEAVTGDDVTVAEVRADGDTLTVRCSGPSATFTFIGQDGATRKTVSGVTEASYVFTPGDTYIRTVVRGPQTELYLNPIVRSDGRAPRAPVAVADPVWTAAFRAAIVAACAAALWLLF